MKVLVQVNVARAPDAPDDWKPTPDVVAHVLHEFIPRLAYDPGWVVRRVEASTPAPGHLSARERELIVDALEAAQVGRRYAGSLSSSADERRQGFDDARDLGALATRFRDHKE